MLISSSKKFIFIHNYKVAGSSVSQALGKYADQENTTVSTLEKSLIKVGMLPKHYPAKFAWHVKAGELKRKLGPTFNEYFKFGFSRNPWDWQVSLYQFMLNNPAHKQHLLIKKMKDFDEYIDWRINKDMELQIDAFYDHDGTCLMDFIGKIENIEEDFQIICQRIRVNESLPHVNRSREDRDFLKYYNSHTIEYVFDAFYKDIQAFGYSKPILVGQE